MHSIGEDSTGVRYHAIRSLELTEASALWSPREFDVTLFTEGGSDDREVDRVVGAILHHDPEWIYTTGSRAEHWHDVADELAVGLGLQQKVGDGHPMTAWFTEIREPGDWTITNSFGEALDHLFVFVGSQSYFERSVEQLSVYVRGTVDEKEAEPGATDNPDEAQRI